MRRGLQILLGILSLVPLAFGAMGMIFGAAGFIPADQVSAELDSQFRFQSAYYFSLSILIWWVIPNVERQTALFRIIIGGLFLGGATRVYSYMVVGPPPPSMLAGMALELSLPLLILWQNKIRKQAIH
jgi:Domain of unknown function (DUF4345)